mmetsp:Transcript_77524/g.224985  ORF Transcript_77524/g.224985 Transcript_77524/m.224985 type:complete len:99 (-) Transcript_77524:274-570(-)
MYKVLSPGWSTSPDSQTGPRESMVRQTSHVNVDKVDDVVDEVVDTVDVDTVDVVDNVAVAVDVVVDELVVEVVVVDVWVGHGLTACKSPVMAPMRSSG